MHVFNTIILTLIVPVVHCNLHEKKIHGDSLWNTKSVVDEATRRQIFYERHQAWPDPKWLKNEHPNYTKRFAERTKEVMATNRSQDRWDQWMFLAQARMMPKFTENQYDVVKVPKEIHDKLFKHFHEMLPTATLESSSQELSGVIGENHALFFPQEELNYQMLHALKPMFEEWSGVELEPTSVYGVRVYRNGSILRDHLDVLETHVISGILHIASDVDEPYEIQIEDGKGVMGSVNLKPGELMFYESAKCYHQRKVPMKGRYYASIFMHYRPKDWTMTRDEPRFAIPPYWADGLPSREEQEEASSSSSNTNQQIPTSNKVQVSFENVLNDELDIELFWINEEDQSELHQAYLPNKSKLTLDTFIGHQFIAKLKESKLTLGRYVLESSHHGHTFKIGSLDKDEL